jgi:hypothetical protein
VFNYAGPDEKLAGKLIDIISGKHPLFYCLPLKLVDILFLSAYDMNQANNRFNYGSYIAKLFRAKFRKKTLKELKEMCVYFRSHKYHSVYFEGYSTHKCKTTLLSYMQKQQKIIKIDLELKIVWG